MIFCCAGAVTTQVLKSVESQSDQAIFEGFEVTQLTLPLESLELTVTNAFGTLMLLLVEYLRIFCRHRHWKSKAHACIH